MYFFSMGCLIVTNAEFTKTFLAKMFCIAIPLPICVIIGSNMSMATVDAKSDGSLIF